MGTFAFIGYDMQERSLAGIKPGTLYSCICIYVYIWYTEIVWQLRKDCSLYLQKRITLLHYCYSVFHCVLETAKEKDSHSVAPMQTFETWPLSYLGVLPRFLSKYNDSATEYVIFKWFAHRNNNTWLFRLKSQLFSPNLWRWESRVYSSLWSCCCLRWHRKIVKARAMPPRNTVRATGGTRAKFTAWDGGRDEK